MQKMLQYKLLIVIYHLKKSQVCKNLSFNVTMLAALCDLSYKKMQVCKNLSFNVTLRAAYCDLSYKKMQVYKNL